MHRMGRTVSVLMVLLGCVVAVDAVLDAFTLANLNAPLLSLVVTATVAFVLLEFEAPLRNWVAGPGVVSQSDMAALGDDLAFLAAKSNVAQPHVSVVGGARFSAQTGGILRPVIVVTPHVLGLSQNARRAVLAHEMGHMLSRHVFVRWALLSGIFFLVVTAESLTGYAYLLNLLYLWGCRQMEYEADAWAARLVGVPCVLEGLNEVKRRVGEWSLWLEWAMPHPTFQKREALLRKHHGIH